MPSRIEDYALIGDCEAAPLVGAQWPRSACAGESLSLDMAASRRASRAPEFIAEAALSEPRGHG